ncbi:hypothetical protein MAR_032997 [Mya arenaria]|uniref:EB domain-containing protein n=1 Tax=Mya arenaria TaxID=6604 RepID=A0ABY7G7Q9_MYAAR|nr:hypothetical protein MAR_032997 [Mya arenaria]
MTKCAALLSNNIPLMQEKKHTSWKIVIYGTEDITPGTLSGPCDGAAGNECTKDPFAVCVDSMCECGQGSHQVGRLCKKDNAFGYWCEEGSTLTYPNSKCFHGIVYCATRFSEMNGTCIKDTGYSYMANNVTDVDVPYNRFVLELIRFV